MWNKLRNFIFEKDKDLTDENIVSPRVSWSSTTSPSVSDFYFEAKKHYCHACDKWFKTRGARNAHMTLKHKNDE